MNFADFVCVCVFCLDGNINKNIDMGVVDVVMMGVNNPSSSRAKQTTAKQSNNQKTNATTTRYMGSTTKTTR